MINTKINLNKIHVEEFEKAMYNINMSVRQIKKSYISCTGYFSSFKNGKQIAFESVLERDFYMMLEFESDVLKYEEQPLSIKYDYLDSKKRKYTPDTLVTYHDNSQKIFEVKYQDEIDNSLELREKLMLLKKVIKDMYGLEFDVYTDTYIDKQVLVNYKFLYKFAFTKDDESKTSIIKSILKESHCIKVKDLLGMIDYRKEVQAQYIPYVWRYVFFNLYLIDRFEKLSINTLLNTKEN